MPHFAKIQNNKVIDVIRIESSAMFDENGNESETVGIEFLTNLLGHTEWALTSYTAEFRGKYAAIGYIWDADKNSFYPEQPFPSWILDENTWEWNPPIPKPGTPSKELWWEWDEAALTWIEINNNGTLD